MNLPITQAQKQRARKLAGDRGSTLEFPEHSVSRSGTPLSARQWLNAATYTMNNPGETRGFFNHLKDEGYDTETFGPLLQFHSNVERMLEGFPRGISAGTMPLTFEERDENKTLNLPYPNFDGVSVTPGFGLTLDNLRMDEMKVDPWLGAGELLGSVMGGAAEMKIGAKILGKPIAKAITRMLPGNAKVPGLGQRKDVRRAALYAGRNALTGVIGGVAQAIREEDFDAVLPGIAYWTALGIIGDGLGRRLTKKILRARALKKQRELNLADREELSEVERIANSIERGDGMSPDVESGFWDYLKTTEGVDEGYLLQPGYMQEMPQAGRYFESPDGNLWRTDNVDVRDYGDFVDSAAEQVTELPAVIRTPEQAERWAADVGANLGEGYENITKLRQDEILADAAIARARGDLYESMGSLGEHHVTREIGQQYTVGGKVMSVESQIDDRLMKHSHGRDMGKPVHSDLEAERFRLYEAQARGEERVDAIGRAWSPDERKMYEAGRWEEFSRSRGYTEDEITDFRRWMEISGGPGDWHPEVTDYIRKHGHKAALARYGDKVGENAGETLFHGRSLRAARGMVQEDGSLVLKSVENFGGRQVGVSFSTSVEEATDYARRIKGGGPEGRRAGVVFEIDRAVLDEGRITQQTLTEIEASGVEDVIIPAGRWRLKMKDGGAVDAKGVSRTPRELADREQELSEKLAHGDDLEERARNVGLDDLEEADLEEWANNRDMWQTELSELEALGEKQIVTGIETLPGRDLFVLLGGTTDGRLGARNAYMETMAQALRAVQDRQASPSAAVHHLHQLLNKLARNTDVYPEGQMTYQTIGTASELHMALFEAIEGSRITASEVMWAMQRALKNGEDVGEILAATKRLNEGLETASTAEKVTKPAPRNVRDHPVFEGLDEPADNAVNLGGQAGATKTQLKNIQRLIAEFIGDSENLRHQLDVNKLLPAKLTVEQAQEVEHNLQHGLARRQVIENDEHMKALLPDMGKASYLRPVDELSGPQLDYTAMGQRKEAKRQSSWLYRNAGLGSTTSPHGGGRNGLFRMYARNTQHIVEQTQSLKEMWRNQMDQIVSLLAPEQMRANQLKGIHDLPHWLFRQTRKAVTGDSKPEDMLIEKLHLLGQALDDEDVLPPYIRNDPQMMEAYKQAKQLTQEIADKLGLPEEAQITNYLAHIFRGTGGEWRSQLIADKLATLQGEGSEHFVKLLKGGINKTNGEMIRGIMELDGEQVAPKILFGHLKARSANRKGYELNFRTVMDIYIEGAADYIAHNRIVREAEGAVRSLPGEVVTRDEGLLADLLGDRSPRKLILEHMAHTIGLPSPMRRQIANFFADSRLFNRAVDQLVGVMGESAEHGRMLDRARNGDPELLEMASNFLDELGEMSRVHDRVTGARMRGRHKWTGDKVGAEYVEAKGGGFTPLPDDELTKDRTWFNHRRARTALRLDDIRNALADPTLQAPLLSQVYRIQMMAKLGANIGFGIVNLGQFITNSYPLLGAEYAGKGLGRYMFKDARGGKIHGKKVADLLTESGLSGDLGKGDEALSAVGMSMKRKWEKVVMAPGQMSESLLRGATMLGEYERLMDKGMMHTTAMHRAVEAATDANFAFNRAGTPPILRWPLVRLALMFQSYTIHQTDFSAQLIGKAGRGIKNQGLISAAMNGELDPLARHILGYLMVAGTGIPLVSQAWNEFMPETNLAERSQPPAPQQLEQMFTNRYDEWSLSNLYRFGFSGLIGDTMSGPFADTVADLIHGQFVDAVQSFAVPSVFTRAMREGVPHSAQDVIDVMGMRKYRGRRRKPKKIKTLRLGRGSDAIR